MIFVLHKTEYDRAVPQGPEPNGLWNVVRAPLWTWTYQQGSPANPGETLAVSPQGYDSEREARSAIAKARKAFGGARMAKVIPSDA